MEKIKFAIQKSGRLTDKSLGLLRDCGYDIEDPSRKLLVPCQNFPLDIFLLRDDDIPQYILDGICDFGIVGQNLLEEKYKEECEGKKIKVVAKLPFGKCRLSLAFKTTEGIRDLKDINGKVIATSYPEILRRTLGQKNIEVKIKTLSGGVEIAPIIDMADGIFDIVSTGSTLKAHGLQETFALMESQCVLISSTKLTPFSSSFIEGLSKRIKSSLVAKKSSYIMLNAPKSNVEKIIEVLPGGDSPSVLDLRTDKSKVSIHALTNKEVVWETMEKLKILGASNILVMPIEKMME